MGFSHRLYPWGPPPSPSGRRMGSAEKVEKPTGIPWGGRCVFRERPSPHPRTLSLRVEELLGLGRWLLQALGWGGEPA